MSAYEKGKRIESLDELARQELIICQLGSASKALSRGWFISWQMKYAQDLITRGALFTAVRKRGRVTARDYFGHAYIPGFAPHCGDEETAKLIVFLTDRLAELEDKQNIKENTD